MCGCHSNCHARRSGGASPLLRAQSSAGWGGGKAPHGAEKPWEGFGEVVASFWDLGVPGEPPAETPGTLPKGWGPLSPPRTTGLILLPEEMQEGRARGSKEHPSDSLPCADCKDPDFQGCPAPPCLGWSWGTPGTGRAPVVMLSHPCRAAGPFLQPGTARCPAVPSLPHCSFPIAHFDKRFRKTNSLFCFSPLCLSCTLPHPTASHRVPRTTPVPLGAAGVPSPAPVPVTPHVL